MKYVIIFFERMRLRMKKLLISVNVNIELDKNVNVGIGQFVPILFKLNDTIILSFLKIDRS